MNSIFFSKHTKVISSILLFILISWGIFSYGKYLWKISNQSNEDYLTSLGISGQEILKDIQSSSSPITKEKETFKISESKNSFPTIYTANAEQPPIQNDDQDKIDIILPQDYEKPIEINLDGQKKIEVTHQGSQGYQSELIEKTDSNPNPTNPTEPNLPPQIPQGKYTLYKSSQKDIYYSFNHKENQKLLKNWILYKKFQTKQQESYKIKNAILRKNSQGDIEAYYFQVQDKPEEIGMVDQNLLVRAQLSVAEDVKKDIEENGGTPDFVIPKPYYIDTNGNRTDLDWEIDQKENTITLSFEAKKDQYPIALDPTLAFSVGSQMPTASVVQGEATGNYFGSSMITGDFNADGLNDLVVGAYSYNGQKGRIYIFNGGNAIKPQAVLADKIITATGTGIFFGYSLGKGDFNNDSKDDLVVGGYGYSTQTGRAYIFYNDGSMPATEDTADVIITGETTIMDFGFSFASGDFNNDGRDDLVVGADRYSAYKGRTYIFYGDGSIPTTAATADVIITGEAASTSFGRSLVADIDFNNDGKNDLVIGAYEYSTSTGRVYIFYNDGSIASVANSADIIITGTATSSYFGFSMASGDIDNDGKKDLIVGAGLSSKAYVFYNDGTIPATTASADISITSTGGHFVTSGDLNGDGRDDIITGNGATAIYISYGDSSIPTTGATADVIINQESANTYFSYFLAVGDVNNDGEDDLVASATQYSTNTGRIYVFYSDAGASDADQRVANSYNDNITDVTVGDFNGDGRDDLAIGYNQYSTSVGRAYIFYNDGSMPKGISAADVTIEGEGANSYFGGSVTSTDFNNDGNDDLVVGARSYSSSAGRVYIFYGDGRIPILANLADIIISGAASSTIGTSMVVGDMNNDSKKDLIVGAGNYSSNTGRVHIFYNDGSIPTTSATADVIITGEADSYFGSAFFMFSKMAVGDFNYDGKGDLAVGADGYNTRTGRAYIFYGDGSIPTTAATADVIITGEAVLDYFGTQITSGDFNDDGKTDLAVGASGYSSSTGRAYIFYNDGTIPTTAATADVIIIGEATGNKFGSSFTSGDFNYDGKTDLVVGAGSYDVSKGRAYIFYNDGTIPTTASSADVMIDGTSYFSREYMLRMDYNDDSKDDLVAINYSSSAAYLYIFLNDGSIPTTAATADFIILSPGASTSRTYFGYSMASGDLNSDGKSDLIVGAYGYGSNTGRVYIFYGNGNIEKSHFSADIVILGETITNYFGAALTTGDFNYDGTIDLAVGASEYSSSIGRAYIFYNDGSIPSAASSADLIISGETGSRLGTSMIGGDFNYDGKTDLAIGGRSFGSGMGRAYIFYNDGSMPTTGATADVKINGEAAGNGFGYTIASGDFNHDGKTDLASGSYYYGTNTGRAYIFYNDGAFPTSAASAEVIITGETTTNLFASMVSGDFNYDGRTDLAVGAYAYNSYMGRAYIFYNDGSIPTSAASADVIITGEATNDSFGYSLASGDFDNNGKGDLAVGAYGNDSSRGKAYVFFGDGSIPTTAATADIAIKGLDASEELGKALASGDFNGDRRTDLAISSYYLQADNAYIMMNRFRAAIDHPAKFEGGFKLEGSMGFD